MPEPMTIWTYDWVPEMPRGHVRDIRLRWALEEAGLPYTVATVPFDLRGPDHIARQPFAQVPFLEDEGIRLFESGACLLHIAERSAALMPSDPQGRADTIQWLIGALNSIEMVSVPWWYVKVTSEGENPLTGWLHQRFDRMEAVLGEREWLAAGRFTVADLLMADVMRQVAKLGELDNYPGMRAYMERVLERPAFRKALDDQLAHFAAGDAARDTA